MLRLLLLTLLLSPLSIVAQFGPGYFSYEDVFPKYSIIVRDSSKVDFLDHDLSSNLVWAATLIKDNDDIYSFYRDWQPSFGGTYIEKRNIVSGELLWWTNTGYNQDSIREAASTFHINEDNNLVVTYYNELLPYTGDYFIFKCKPSVRIYDGQTGEVLEYVTNDNIGLESKGMIDWYFSAADFFPTDEGYTRVRVLRDLNEFDYQLKRFDKDLNLTQIDTVFLDRERSSYSRLSNTRKFKDNFVMLRHSSEYTFLTPKVDSLFADYVAYLDIYNSNFEYDYSVDITGVVPYYWSFSRPRKVGDSFVLPTQDSVDVNVQKYRAFSYFDQEGQLLKIDDFSNIKLSEMFIADIPGTNRVLYLAQRYEALKEFYWDFYISDASGNINKLETITPRPGNTFGSVSELAVTEDLEIFVKYTYHGYDNAIEGLQSGFSNYVLTAFNGADIGLIPVSTKDVQQDEMQHVFEVSPNPAISDAVLTFDKAVSGTLSIRSIDGRLHSSVAITQQQEYVLDVSSMVSGTYLVTLEGDDGVVDTRRLLVHYNR